MFNKYLDEHEILKLPISGNMYNIHIEGKVYDIYDNELEIRVDRDGNKIVRLYWLKGYNWYKLALLIAFTFKPIKLPFNEWSKLDVMYKDLDSNNMHPSNLIWKFPIGGIECKSYPGFYYIPSYTKYIIDRNGNVIQYLFNKSVNKKYKNNGYVTFTIMNEFINYSIKRYNDEVGLHRLLALTFLPYDERVDSLDVNHIDGNPLNNNLSNLEWVTRQHNCLHAFANGLRKDNKHVLVTNHSTGEVTEYFSAGECERRLGLKRSVVHYRIKMAKDKIFPPGLSFRYKDDTSEPDIIALNQKRIDRYGIPVIMENTKTGEILKFDSIIKCADYLGVVKKVVQRRLKYDSNPTYKYYKFSKDVSSTLSCPTK